MRIKFVQNAIDIVRLKKLREYLSYNSIALKTLLNIIDIFSYGSHKMKVKLLRFAKAKIDDDFNCGSNCDIYMAQRLEAEGNIYIGDNAVIRCWNKIKIGKYTFTGPNCVFLAGSHKTDNYQDITTGQEIKIGRGCWIGGNVTILGAADIGDGCVIGAGSVVLGKKYPPYTIIAGVPAKVIKDRETKDVIMQPCKYKIKELKNA